MRLYEIIGSIVVLATLFSSVGFSGWTYGSNLIQNGNFSEVRVDNASLPAGWYTQNWSDCSLMADTSSWGSNQIGYITGEYASVNWSEIDIELGSSPILLQQNKSYYFSFDFYPYGTPDQQGALYLVMNNSECSNAVYSPEDTLVWNSTSKVTGHAISDSGVFSLGGGWYRINGIWTMDNLQGDSVYTRLVFGWGYSGLEGNYSLDNVVLKEATYTPEPCQGWECASTARSVVGLAPIVVGLGLLAGMVGMFLMRDEEESMIALVMKGGVIALIAVVMLAILVSVIG